MRKLLTVVFAATVALVVPALPASAAGIDWSPCSDGQNVECATVQLPVDWSRPDGAKVGIAINRLKAAKPEQRKGALLVNPGGPGGSGLNFVYSASAGNYFSQSILDSFDLIGFDPRGVGQSSEIQCDKAVLSQPVQLIPATEQQYTDLLARNGAIAQDCPKHNAGLDSHVDTESVVRDMDGIRAALGEEQISFYGVSYGTQIGQQYAELFGSRLRALVLDSNMDHSVQSEGYLAAANKAFENSFTDFAAWCDRTASCALHGQDVLALWDKLYAQASAGKLIDPASGKPLSVEALRDNVFGNMYHPADQWGYLASRLASLAGTGAPSASAQAAAELVGNSYQAIWCSDWRWPEVSDFASLSKLRENVEALAPHTHFSGFFSDITNCLGWTGPVSNPQHELHVTQAPPILMTNGLHDVATPYEWATNVAQQLPDTVLLTYDGTGHGDYGNSTCARDAIDTYLLTLARPAQGTHCAAEWPTGTAPQTGPHPVTRVY
ncbi:alpha/beta fold hydrolase [Amycolatopsis sp. NBC_01480]|uniref:alpha/beta fold hydrolase n=1 Tax=Amycolatopsis sp. NBC_01480 TaxID=2903562 RepID=UPI002E289CEF|nr:alpha/beta fold hydrolase [Amycolatopsis sp. NBC_01480]